MTRAITRFDLFTDLECRGGARLATGGFVAASSAVTTKSLEQVESITLTMPRSVEAASAVREGHILRRWRSDTLVEEWPIGPITIARGQDATVTVVARSLLYRLGECGLVTQPGVDPQDGLPILQFSVSGTPAELVAAYLTARAPADALATALAWLGLGTMDPTTIVTLDVDWWSPLQFLRAIIDALESANAFAELWLRRNGTTNYLIDILTTPLAT